MCKLNNYPASAVYSSDKWRDWAKEVYRDKLGMELYYYALWLCGLGSGSSGRDNTRL